MSTVITDLQARDIVAENLDRFMRDRGMSQAQLALLSGENEARISDLRNRKKNPQMPFVLRLCEALGITPNDLLLPTTQTRRKKSA
jgi:transcriptional regulator with XRE-family HTH domain